MTVPCMKECVQTPGDRSGVGSALRMGDRDDGRGRLIRSEGVTSSWGGHEADPSLAWSRTDPDNLSSQTHYRTAPDPPQGRPRALPRRFSDSRSCERAGTSGIRPPPRAAALKTSAGPSPALRATPTPYSRSSRPLVEWASGLIAIATPMRRGPPAMDGVEVEPVRVGVDLDHRAGLRGSLDHRVEVHRVPVAGQQQPAGRVAEHRHPGVRDRPDDPRASSHARGMPKLE